MTGIYNHYEPRSNDLQVQRRALLVLALCMEAGRFGLLLPLLSEEASGPSLVHRLVTLVDGATRFFEEGGHVDKRGSCAIHLVVT